MVESMRAAAAEAGVEFVTGDTKVVIAGRVTRFLLPPRVLA